MELTEILFIIDDCNNSEDLQLNSIMGLTYSAFQQLMGPLSAPQILNPIDRLYSMQNSYFRSDDGKYHSGNDIENWICINVQLTLNSFD